MINIQIQDQVIQYSKDLVKKVNFGMRGVFDGTKENQFFGVVAENTIRKYYGIELMKPKKGWDGGYDFEWNGYKADVKCTIRTVEPKPNFACNFTELQKNHIANAFIFTSLNKTNKVLTLCGWIDKKTFFEKAIKFDEGEKIYRSNGTSFPSSGHHYEIKILDLKKPFYNFE